MTQSLVEATPPRPAPLARVPSAPGSLRGLSPLGGTGAQSPVSPRRVADSPRLPRRQIPQPVHKPASFLLTDLNIVED